MKQTIYTDNFAITRLQENVKKLKPGINYQLEYLSIIVVFQHLNSVAPRNISRATASNKQNQRETVVWLERTYRARNKNVQVQQ